jgi:protein-tyrosine phosphatase
MWSYIEHLQTSSKIMYDKTTDIVSYYCGISNNEEEIISDTEPEIKFEDTNNNCRIYPTESYYNSYKSFSSEPTLIIDNIYLGSAYNAASLSTLNKFEIKVIINATTEIRNYYPDDFTYYKYSLYDNNECSINKYLDESFKTIKHHQDNTSGNILVHCFMGASRSVSIVVNYIMKVMKNSDGSSYTFDDALQYIKNKRPIVNPTHKLAGEIIKHNKKIDL